MKTIKFIYCGLCFCCLMLTGCMSEQRGNPDDIILNVEFSGLEDNTPVEILLAATQEPEEALQTISLVGGKGQFNLKAEGPRLYYVRVADSYEVTELALDRGNIATLTATVKKEEPHEGIKQDKPVYSFADEQVTGTSLQEEYIRRRVNRDSLNLVFNALHQLADSAEMAKAEAQFFHDIDSIFKATFQASGDSWWGPALLMDSYTYISEEQKTEYEQFSDAAKESFYGLLLKEKLWPSSIEGKQMPDFTFTNRADGKQLSLKSTLVANRYVLLDFWASWCKPCRKEIPNLQELYVQFHSQGFEIISISADDDESAWLRALDEEKLPWLNDRDGNQNIGLLYKVNYYPTIYLLNSEGKVVAKDIRGEELSAKLQELFDK